MLGVYTHCPLDSVGKVMAVSNGGKGPLLPTTHDSEVILPFESEDEKTVYTYRTRIFMKAGSNMI